MYTFNHWWTAQNFLSSSLIKLPSFPLRNVYNSIINQNEVKLWNRMAAMMDYTFPSKDALKDEDLAFKLNNEPLKSELTYCMTYAAYIYYFHFLGNPKHMQIIKTYNIFDSIHVDRPSYFIAIDENEKRILLCIHGGGSSNISDTLHNLKGGVTQKSFGYDHIYVVHEAMYNATMSIYHDVTFEISQLANNAAYNEYQILLTGHSLGAGICSILGLLWNVRKKVDPTRFMCYSFASPLIVGKNARQKSMEYKNMISVACSTDIIARISNQRLLVLNARISVLKEDPQASKRVIDGIIAKRTGTKPFDFDEEEKELCQRLKDVKKHSYIDPTAFLYPCGKIYWFVPWFIIDANKGNKQHLTYQRLCAWENLCVEITPFQNATKYLKELYDELFATPLTSDVKLVSLEKKNCAHNAEKEDSLKYDETIYPFSEIVCYGSESWEAHKKERYIRCIDKSVIDIFEESRMYHTAKRVPMLQKLLDVLICAHLFVLFILHHVPLPSIVKRQIIYLYLVIVIFITRWLCSIGDKYNNNPDPSEQMKTPQTALQEVEKNLDSSYARLVETLQISKGEKDNNAIQNLIATKYATSVTPVYPRRSLDSFECGDDDDDDESSLDESEKMEIERRKSQLSFVKGVNKVKVNTAKLFRPGTTTMWDEEDLNQVQSEMNRELEAMHNDENVNNRNVSGTMVKKRPSQLLRLKSTSKWANDRLKTENEEMQAQLASLVVAHKPTMSTDEQSEWR